MTKLLTFHNDPAIKEKYLARIRAHMAADEIVQGIGFDGKRGCAVGCTLDKYDHSAYPAELGIPEWVARLQDEIHEGLPIDIAKKWPERLLNACPVGVDLEQVKAPFMIFVLSDCLTRFDHDKFPEVKSVIDKVIYLYTSGCTQEEQWDAAESAATAAAAESFWMSCADKLVEIMREAK